MRDQFVKLIEEPEKPVSRFRGTGQRTLIPRNILVGSAAQNLLDQAVLASKVFVERPASDIRLLEYRVYPNRGAA
jgi:hypothetical protein